MEGYAVAYACQRLGVPVRLVKHVSDAADESALDWPAVVDASARVLGEWVAEHAGRSDGGTASSVAGVTTTAVPLLADSVRLRDEADGGGVDILDRRVYPHQITLGALPHGRRRGDGDPGHGDAELWTGVRRERRSRGRGAGGARPARRRGGRLTA